MRAIIVVLYITLFHPRHVFSWSLFPPGPPSIPCLSPSSEITTDVQLRQRQPLHSILLSTTILIACQFSTLTLHHHANAATLPPHTTDATTTISNLSYTTNLLSSLEPKSTSQATSNYNPTDSDDNAKIDIDLQKIEQSLAKPTNERPQIQLPTDYNDNIGNTKNENTNLNLNFNNRNNNNQIEPFLQGLIYLLNNNDRPDYSDTIVITVSSTTDPEVIVAGAKFPVAKARFPFQFRLYRANIINKQVLDQEIKNQDLIVMARICPTTDNENENENGVKSSTNEKRAPKIPCEVNESTYLAKGISKAISNLPGMEEGTILRTAAALPLERNGRQ